MQLEKLGIGSPPVWSSGQVPVEAEDAEGFLHICT